jgi:type IV pilus assembly protein PilM
MKPIQRLTRWLNAMPHPPIAIEVAWDQISGVRWSHSRDIEEFIVERLPAGAIVPSAVEPNIVNYPAVQSAMARVCGRLRASAEVAAMLLPDPVIRVFVQHFEEFPRSPKEGVPLLRWKLKKSIPFEMADTVLSYSRRASDQSGVVVVTAVARQRIIREYEELMESAGLHAGVVMSSSLAALALLEDLRPTLLARISNRVLTTAIVRAGVLCGFRCTELPSLSGGLTPQELLDEIYPVAAYYQDTWHAPIECVRVSGIGERLPEFIGPLEVEFHCDVRPLLPFEASDARFRENAGSLLKGGVEGLAGWMLNRD